MKRPRGRRAVLEVLLLLGVLAALQAGQLFLGSPSGLRAFARGEPVVDLSTLAPGRLDADGFLRLPAATGPPAIARLGGFEPEAGRRYLLLVRAAAGLPYAIQLIDRQAERAVRNWAMPLRGASTEHTLPIESWALGRPVRIEIHNPKPFELAIERFEVRELNPSHAWIYSKLRPLALALIAFFVLFRRRELAAYFAGAAADRRAPSGELLVTGLVFLVCFHVFVSAPVQQLLDAKFSTVVSHRLLHDGKLALPEDFSAVDPEALPYQVQRVGDRLYHFFPHAVAILNVPFVAVFEVFGVSPLGENGVFLRVHEQRILGFAAAFQAAALCALLFLLARLFLSPGPALVLSGVFAFGTQIFSSVSRPYWSHAWALLLLAAALYLLLAPGTRDRRWALAGAATLLSWSFFCRPPISLAIIGVVAYLLIRKRRGFALFAATGALWAALYAVYSLATFDHLLPPYYLYNLEAPAGQSPFDHYLSGASGTLFSPSRGLFVYVPFLVVVLILAVRLLPRLADRALAVVALAVSFAHWQILAVNRSWWGGQSFGPRLFSDILVWLFLLACLVWPVWWRRLRAARRPARIALLSVTALLVAVAIFIHTRGATSRPTYMWEGYSLFDWRHPQFLAGLVPEPRPRTLGQRLADLRQEGSATERDRVLEDLLRDEQLGRKWIEVDRTLAAFVTWDGWTYGDAPAAVVAINDGDVAVEPAVRLATWAGAERYPITVRVEDGEKTVSHRLARPGVVEIALGSVPPRSRRLFVVWSDTAWTPGERDPRTLGVQLLPPAGG